MTEILHQPNGFKLSILAPAMGITISGIQYPGTPLNQLDEEQKTTATGQV